MTSSNKYTQTEIEKQSNPFYRVHTWETCNLLVEESSTMDQYNSIKTDYQNRIDAECEKLDEIFKRINEIQMEGTTKLSKHMKGKQIYYWSSTDKKYHLTTLDHAEPVHTSFHRNMIFRYNPHRFFEHMDISFQLNGQEYSSYDLCPTSKDNISLHGSPIYTDPMSETNGY